MSDAALAPIEEDELLNTRRQGDEILLLVKGSTSVHKLSGALLSYIREGNLRIVARAMGAGAVNQAAKACAVTRTLGAREGYNITFILEFTQVEVHGEGRSAMSFVICYEPQG